MAGLDPHSRRSRLPRRPAAERTGLRLWPIGLVLVGAVLIGVLAVIGLFTAGWFLLGVETIKPEPRLTPGTAFDLLKLAFAVVAGLGAVVGLVVAYRRQRTTEAENDRAERAADREATRLFTERFTTAAGQLGEDKPVARLAGVHALAHLADDAPAPDLRQMCIDVLCDYLRMPYTPAAVDHGDYATEEQHESHRARTLEFGSLREVRHTILRIIGQRLREDTPWRGHDFDFTGTVFDGGAFRNAVFDGGTVDFTRALFSGGAVDFSGAEVRGGTVYFTETLFDCGEASFDHARFSGGTVDFTGTEFTDSEVSFNQAEFSGGSVDFTGADFTGGRVSFTGAAFRGARVSFSQGDFSGGTVDFTNAEFSGGGVSFYLAKFRGGTVNFDMARFLDGAVDFTGARFTDGKVSFNRSRLSSGAMAFDQAEFLGGKVDFAGLRSRSPANCPDVLLERVAAGAPGVVRLPMAWRPPACSEDAGHPE